MYYSDILNDYYYILERKFSSGKLSHKQFGKSLEKLDEWYSTFEDTFGIEHDEEDE
jgi:hypothetical protein